MNSGLTSHQQRGHTETGPRFKVSSERPEKRVIDLATPGLVGSIGMNGKSQSIVSQPIFMHTYSEPSL